MAGTVNKVILIGRAGEDPETRTTQDGRKIVHLTLATDETWADRTSGERRQRTEWHRIVVLNEKLGEIAEKYLRKGHAVYLEGQLQTRKWTDQSGQDRFTTEIVLGQYKATLVLLHGRDERAGDDASAGEGTRSGASSRPRGTQQQWDNAQGAMPRSGSNGGRGDGSLGGGDLDDEIPF